MERRSTEQLKWVQANQDRRVRRRFPSPVGQIAEAFAQSSAVKGPAWRRRLIGLLSEKAPELLEHASIVGVRGGVLRLHVVEPALMYNMRLAWEQRLLGMLAVEMPESGIHAIRFQSGPMPDALGD